MVFHLELFVGILYYGKLKSHREYVCEPLTCYHILYKRKVYPSMIEPNIGDICSELCIGHRQRRSRLRDSRLRDSRLRDSRLRDFIDSQFFWKSTLEIPIQEIGGYIVFLCRFLDLLIRIDSSYFRKKSIFFHETQYFLMVHRFLFFLS